MDKAEKVFMKYAEQTTLVDDKWFIPRDTLKDLHSGVTFVRDSNTPIKVMYEGRGLDRFTGKFKDLAKSKGPVDVANVNIDHIKKPSKESLDSATAKFREDIRKRSTN